MITEDKTKEETLNNIINAFKSENTWIFFKDLNFLQGKEYLLDKVEPYARHVYDMKKNERLDVDFLAKKLELTQEDMTVLIYKLTFGYFTNSIYNLLELRFEIKENDYSEFTAIAHKDLTDCVNRITDFIIINGKKYYEKEIMLNLYRV